MKIMMKSNMIQNIKKRIENRYQIRCLKLEILNKLIEIDNLKSQLKKLQQ